MHIFGLKMQYIEVIDKKKQRSKFLVACTLYSTYCLKKIINHIVQYVLYSVQDKK